MKKKIAFYDDAVDGKDCVLHFSSSGSKEGILDSLKTLIYQIESSYGKPMQGCCSTTHNTVIHVITPIWNGEKY